MLIFYTRLTTEGETKTNTMIGVSLSEPHTYSVCPSPQCGAEFILYPNLMLGLTTQL